MTARMAAQQDTARPAAHAGQAREVPSTREALTSELGDLIEVADG